MCMLLGFGEYSFYSHASVTARVLRGDVAKATEKLVFIEESIS